MAVVPGQSLRKYDELPSVETTIFIARHGETLWNLEKRMQGQKDSSLTEKGLKQAETLANALRVRMSGPAGEGTITSVWSSCLGRAKRTAEICAEVLDAAVTPAKGLNEIALGQWEGLTFQEAEKMSPEQFYNFWHRPSKYIPTAGGETFQELQDRMINVLKSICSTHAGQNVLVISHWIAIKTVLVRVQGLGLDDIPAIPRIKNGSFHTIKMTEFSAEITYGE